jgi:glucose-6-phosphate dehydrogenase assembly protein OpcA
MRESTSTKAQQISIEATLDVQAIERELNELWMQNAGASEMDEEGAMLRARVLNLMVYVTSEQALGEVDEMLMDVAGVHPCRALVMLADLEGADKDIEMHVSSRCQREGGAGGRHLCCEQVTLRAGGRFALELPSACVPLLVSDLPVFLCWRAPLGFNEQTFQNLMRAADRVIIDTALCLHPDVELRALAGFLQRQRKTQTGLSDLNWTRLNAWRSLLASFYDAQEHRHALESLSRVIVEYVAPQAAPETVAPKALILAGWLASRLGWRGVKGQTQAVNDGAHLFSLEKNGRRIVIEFRQVSHQAVAPGGIARVELAAGTEPPLSFVVMRAEDGRNLKTQESSETHTRATRVLAPGDRTEAELLSIELEILSHDRIYEDAVAKAVEMLDSI